MYEDQHTRFLVRFSDDVEFLIGIFSKHAGRHKGHQFFARLWPGKNGFVLNQRAK